MNKDDKVHDSVFVDNSLTPESKDLEKSLPDDLELTRDAPEFSSALESLGRGLELDDVIEHASHLSEVLVVDMTDSLSDILHDHRVIHGLFSIIVDLITHDEAV